MTRTVPASVPSDFHSSSPWVPSEALKNTVPLTLVRERGAADPLPARRSLTSTVPASVPSDFHSSAAPWWPCWAVKYTQLPTWTKFAGLDPAGLGSELMSAINCACRGRWRFHYAPQFRAVGINRGGEEQGAADVRQSSMDSTRRARRDVFHQDGARCRCRRTSIAHRRGCCRWRGKNTVPLTLVR